MAIEQAERKILALESIAKSLEQQTLRPWQFGVKVETNAKGWIQPSVHVYSDKCDCEELAVILLERLVKQLKRSGFNVATSLPELAIEKENNKKE